MCFMLLAPHAACKTRELPMPSQHSSRAGGAARSAPGVAAVSSHAAAAVQHADLPACLPPARPLAPRGRHACTTIWCALLPLCMRYYHCVLAVYVCVSHGESRSDSAMICHMSQT